MLVISTIVRVNNISSVVSIVLCFYSISADHETVADFLFQTLPIFVSELCLLHHCYIHMLHTTYCTGLYLLSFFRLSSNEHLSLAFGAELISNLLSSISLHSSGRYLPTYLSMNSVSF